MAKKAPSAGSKRVSRILTGILFANLPQWINEVIDGLILRPLRSTSKCPGVVRSPLYECGELLGLSSIILLCFRSLFSNFIVLPDGKKTT